MIPWVQVYSNLPHHPKIARLADELGLSSAAVSIDTMAVGIVVSLWAWAIQNAYTGDLTDISDRMIAEACKWKKKPETLVQALITAGWIDADRHIHDWEEYSVLLLDAEDERRQKTAERVRRYRSKKKLEMQRTSNNDVTVTSNNDVTPSDADDTRRNAPTIPYHYTDDDDATRAPAREGETREGGYKKDPQGEITPFNNPNLGRVLDLYMNRVNALPPEMVVSELSGFVSAMGPEVCEYAINYAIAENNIKWSYIRGILRGYMQDGVRNMNDLLRANAEFDRRREGTQYAGNRRNSQKRAGGTPPASTDPVKGFSTEPDW